MATRGMTFSGGFLLGAGLVYLLDPERFGERFLSAPSAATAGGPNESPRRWGAGLQCFAGALGVAALAYGANWIASRGKDTSTATALDIDMPNYAWLR